MLETQRDSGNARVMLETPGKLELPGEAGIPKGMFGTQRDAGIPSQPPRYGHFPDWTLSILCPDLQSAFLARQVGFVVGCAGCLLPPCPWGHCCSSRPCSLLRATGPAAGWDSPAGKTPGPGAGMQLEPLSWALQSLHLLLPLPTGKLCSDSFLEAVGQDRPSQQALLYPLPL